MIMGKTETVVCAKPNCKVGETGKCLEGLAIDRCPHRTRKEAVPPAPATKESNSTQESTSADPKVLELPSGRLLIPSTAVSIIRSRICHVVALIGPNDAGKTTLVISLYEMFQQAPTGGFRFSGSRTLYDFEQVCHLGRAASGRSIPRTERTSRAAGIKFFHLGLVNENDNKTVNFLFSERAGEDYKSIADDPSIVSEFPEITRADCVSIVVDGERLADIGARHNVKSDALLILQGLSDEKAVNSQQRLAIVLTKYDKVMRSHAKDRADSDFNGLVRKIRTLFSGDFSEIEAFKTAARPDSSEVKRGLGLADLLQFWARPQFVLPYRREHTPSPRMFSRFLSFNGK